MRNRYHADEPISPIGHIGPIRRCPIAQRLDWAAGHTLSS
jgi:hypothetical protein